MKAQFNPNLPANRAKPTIDLIGTNQIAHDNQWKIAQVQTVKITLKSGKYM
jgi:hypothetical protein